MVIVGITGSIAVGKSFVCDLLKGEGYKVFEADIEVGKMLTQIELQQQIVMEFPTIFKNHEYCKKMLSQEIFADLHNLYKLEQIIHPIIKQKAQDFVHSNPQEKIVFIEAPLLIESGMHTMCDVVWLVSAPYDVIKTRALERENMNEEKLSMILRRQMSQEEKIKFVDTVINTNVNVDALVLQIDKAISKL